ncbi:MAG: hypothetical protein HS104_16355 [Polyangiaceae bacterium]|nr:hypothetical protein [Polyangiaceae bacterium]
MNYSIRAAMNLLAGVFGNTSARTRPSVPGLVVEPPEVGKGVTIGADQDCVLAFLFTRGGTPESTRGGTPESISAAQGSSRRAFEPAAPQGLLAHLLGLQSA